LKSEDKKLGVAQTDLYQMYAYVTHWNADAVVLLYPSISEEVKKIWHFNIPTAKDTQKVPLFIETVNLEHDLLGNDWEVFLREIKDLLSEILRVLSE